MLSLENLFPLFKDSQLNSNGCLIKGLTSLSQQPNLLPIQIELEKSPIHGHGVFATTDIKEGEIVTFYPSHGFYMNTVNGYKPYVNDNEKDFKTSLKYYIEKYCFHAECTKFGQYGVIGNPKSTKNPFFLGHMVNDGVGNIFSNLEYKKLTLSDFKNAIIRYVLSSATKTNCKILSHPDYPLVYVQTTKPIPSGTELLTAYAPMFWYCASYNKTEEEFSGIFGKVCDENMLRLIDQIY